MNRVKNVFSQGKGCIFEVIDEKRSSLYESDLFSTIS
jgi:hypothetical protein